MGRDVRHGVAFKAEKTSPSESDRAIDSIFLSYLRVFPDLISHVIAYRRGNEREVDPYSSIGAPMGAYIINIPFWKVRSVSSVARPARARR